MNIADVILLMKRRAKEGRGVDLRHDQLKILLDGIDTSIAQCKRCKRWRRKKELWKKSRLCRVCDPGYNWKPMASVIEEKKSTDCG